MDSEDLSRFALLRLLSQAMRYLVDGHNAIFRLGISGPDRESERKELVDVVAAVAGEVEIYFDARRAPEGLPSYERRGNVRVHYCRGEEADRAILGRVREADRPADLVVVSDDLEVRNGAVQLGARGISVAAFADVLDPPEPASPEKPPSGTGGFSPEDFGLPDHVSLEHPPRDLGDR